MTSKEAVNINVRIPLTLKKTIERHVRLDNHLNFSDFVRDALRAKLRSEAPWLGESGMIAQMEVSERDETQRGDNG